MQQSGTLKKRKRRNIARVTGLAIKFYDADLDNFDGKTVFNSSRSSSSRGETRISVSSLLQRSREEHSTENSRWRITRDPRFHVELAEDSENELELVNSHHQYQQEEADPDEKIIRDRPYFLDKKMMSRLRQILILGMFSGTFPWSWNERKHKVDKWNPTLISAWNIQWVFVSLQTTILTLFQFYSMYKQITEEEHTSFRGLFMSSHSVLWYFICMGFNINMYFYKDQTRLYINTLFKLNRELVKKYVVSLEDYVDGGKIVLNLSIPSSIFQVFISVALFVLLPFQPWYLFSYIYPKPWYWLIPGAIQEFIVVGQVIANYALYQWIIVAHANSLEFWLRESHRGYDSGYTLEEFRNPKTAVETYRSLQVVTVCFNDCMASLALPVMKICMVWTLISCGFVVVRSMNHVFIQEFPGILTYPLGITVTGTTAFCTMSLAAVVYDLGCGFVDSWSLTRHKDFRRILMSCPTLKVKVARYYFVTVATTITFFKTVTDFIISCIITFP
ncbi:unnamed protein product [Orchesella dallaii]|uniref:Gustatory receptor n=1 Tax=Orchesella dallaii TaxID=48710 RepID=A0ABP1S3W0_9HEXA